MRPQLPDDDISQHLSVQERLRRLEQAVAPSGLRAGRWYAASIQTTVDAGWSWSPHGLLVPDGEFFGVISPGGAPGGVAAAASSGVQVLKSGVYRADASLLQYFAATTSGRVDAALQILSSDGDVFTFMDQSLSYVPSGTLYVKATLSFEATMTAGQVIWAQNVGGQAYGDVGGNFSWLNARYLGP